VAANRGGVVLKGIEKLAAERDRLIGWVVDDSGVRVTIRPGDRVAFSYRGVARVGVVVRLTSTGFAAVEHGGSRAKSFRRDRVTGFSLVTAE
jgi:hypothetical protein